MYLLARIYQCTTHARLEYERQLENVKENIVECREKWRPLSEIDFKQDKKQGPTSRR